MANSSERRRIRRAQRELDAKYEDRQRRQHRQYRKALQDAFLGTTPYIYERDSRWTGVRQLGRGGQGIVGLWVKSDDQGRVVERMVVKETQPSKDIWDQETTWMPNSNRQIPREAISMLFSRGRKRQLRGIVKCFRRRNRAMRALSRGLARLGLSSRQRPDTADPEADPYSDDEVYDEDSDDELRATPTGDDRPMQEILESLNTTPLPLPAAPQPGTHTNPLDHDNGIVQTFAYAVQPERMTWRLYMEYLACGDADELSENHARALDGLSEPFLWFLLYRLMRACIEMEQIRSIPGGAHRLLHQDLKLQNIFFGRANQGHYPLYPLGKIGDFGSARIFTGAHGVIGGGDAMTNGWIAPEYFNDNGYYVGGAITPAANTWGAARNILALILLHQPHPGDTDALNNISAMPADAMANIVASAAAEDDDFGTPLQRQDLLVQTPQHQLPYSPELFQVLRGCLARYPRNRYHARNVMAYIRANEARFLGGMGPDGVVSFDAGRRVRIGGDGLDHAYRDGMRFSRINRPN